MNKNKKALIILNISKPIQNIIKRFALVILVIVALMAVFVSSGNNHFFKRSTLTDIFAPAIAKISLSLKGFNDFFANFSEIWHMREINDKINNENKILRSKLLDVEGLISENDKLRRILNFTDHLEYNFITTQIIGNFSSPFISSVLINSGENRGLKEGFAVVNEVGLIGRIKEVGKYSSRVLLITDIDSQIPVKTLTSGEKAIMSGSNNMTPDLKYKSLDSKINDKEIIVTSGEGDIYPPNIKIGSVIKQDNKIERVMPFVNMGELDYVSVIMYKPIIKINSVDDKQD